jgi:hypothetical protein
LDELATREARGLVPPPIHYEERTISYEVVNADIALNEISFQIVECQGLYVNGQNIPDPYVSIEWPAASSDTSPTTFSTAVFKKTSSTDFGKFTRLIPLACNRNSKAYLRFLEKKRIVLEAFHNRGFLFKSVSLGKVLFPLSDLIGKSTVVLTGDFIEDSSSSSSSSSSSVRGKKTGASIKIILKQRQPAQGRDLREERLNLLVFDFDDDNNNNKKTRFENIFLSTPASSSSTTTQKKATATTTAKKESSGMEEDEELFK